MDFLKDFGVQPILLAAQAVNFFVLLFILKRFLYKPLLKVLEERKQKIAQSLQNAEEIQKKLEQTEADREKRLRDAAKEARLILEDATKTSTQLIEEAKRAAGKDAVNIIEKAHQAMRLEQEKMYQQMRRDLANLVVLGLEKVSGKVLNEKDQRELVENSLKDLQK